jgi:hypothetical protein
MVVALVALVAPTRHVLRDDVSMILDIVITLDAGPGGNLVDDVTE